MRLLRWLRRLWEKPAPLDERACYERLHGQRDGEVRTTGVVMIARPEPRQPRLLPRLSGEHLRRCFEKRLESRHRHAA